MEGLIPFVYRVIVEYKNGNKDHNTSLLSGCWFNDSPSASYIRLPGDSGRFQAPDIAVFTSSDRFGFSSLPSGTQANNDAASSSPIMALPSGVLSPVRRRSVAA